MVSIRIVVLMAATSWLVGCAGNILDHPWVDGMSRKDAIEISDALAAEVHSREVTRFDRQPDGSIIVWTDVGSYSVRRINGKWKVGGQVVITS